MIYVGLDLHRRYVTACALDSSGTLLGLERRLPPTEEVLLTWLGTWPQPLTIALEATLYWAWLHDHLAAAGYAVAVAHPEQVKLICHARCKTDPIDARKLADLCRTQLLPTIWVPDPATRARRTLLRGRVYLVRLRTQLKNRIHGYLAEANYQTELTDLYGKAGRAWLAALPLPLPIRQQILLLLAQIDQLTTQVTTLDRQVRAEAAGDALAQQLQSVPGLGPFGALLFAAEVGPISRFASAHALASYAGLVPSTRSSGGKTAHGPVGPSGNHWLKWLLIEAVQTLKRRPGPVREHYERHLRAKGKPKATVAAARKLCGYLYWMLREGLTYESWLAQYERHRVRPGRGVASVATASA
jgi:transposase